MTDHDTVRGYRKVKELAKPYPDIVVIPGVEVSATEGDILMLGIPQLPPKPWTPENIIHFAKENNGITIAAHPYRSPGLGDTAADYDLDGIEVLNGISSPGANKMARRLAEATDLPGVAGSDAHRAEELWTVYTEVEASSHVNDILKAVKKGMVRVAYTRGSIRF